MQDIPLKALDRIPMDVMGVIYTYIPWNIRRTVTKKAYTESYPYFIDTIATHNQLDTYTRSLIRKQQSFPFSLLLPVKYDIWYKIKNVRSKIGHITLFKAPNYIAHLKELCKYYKSNACRMLIIEYEKANGKKTHKKIKFKNIRWSN